MSMIRGIRSLLVVWPLSRAPVPGPRAAYGTAITCVSTVPRGHHSIPSEETPARTILTALTAILLVEAET
jgi:hypothetical protein